MLIGVTLGRYLAARFLRMILGVFLTVFALVAENAIAGMILLLALAITSQLMGPSLQLFLLDASPDAPSLAAALHHSALNIGNSLGAALALSVAGAAFAAAERQDVDPFATVFVFAALGGLLGVVASARTAA